MFCSGNPVTRIKMTKTKGSPRKIQVKNFIASLKASRLKKASLEILREKTRQNKEAEVENWPVIENVTAEPSSLIQVGFQLTDRRSEMSESTHPSDSDPPPVYTAQAFQNCLDVGNSWKQVVFLDQLNKMTADEFLDAICNTSAFFGGEGYWWQDLMDKRYLAERRQCIAFNLRRFDSVASSNKDYLSAIADSMEDAQQLWRNKTCHLPADQQEDFRLVLMT
jgi:hypothetical protein